MKGQSRTDPVRLGVQDRAAQDRRLPGTGLAGHDQRHPWGVNVGEPVAQRRQRTAAAAEQVPTPTGMPVTPSPAREVVAPLRAGEQPRPR